MQNSFSQEPNVLIAEREEWLEALDDIYREHGEEGVLYIVRSIQDRALNQGVSLGEATLNTPYVNTIPVSEQPPYPGNIELEKRIENILRWNAMAMVLRAADNNSGVGGHIATFASAATMLEVGFNHFFRARSDDYAGDILLPQPHSAPGIYARAFLEGRLTKKNLQNFRRELQEGGGLSSYPHPRSMPNFWEMPNASMGLSTSGAIYQARFSRYLENRGLKKTSGEKIWCFIGDGESDEPEVLGTINIAARERLHNLVLVINCNLQRLDGPVRGNGKIIQELERSFRGADWNVIKVIWGSGWDTLLNQDHKGILRNRMKSCLDGDYQRYSVLPGDAQREHWVDGDPELEKMMQSLSDEELRQIKRGGQDPKKIYAAYKKASESKDRPTVILIKTVKGDGMGSSAQGRNTAHQKKNLSKDERVSLATSYGIPISEKAMRSAEFYLPSNDSIEMKYLKLKREKLGGYLPERSVDCPNLNPPSRSIFKKLLEGSGHRDNSTTMGVVQMLRNLMKDEDIGRLIVPIVPDEARTFGMDGLFSAAGIYSSDDQKYTPVDADSAMSYREATDGQILQEGICETGAIASFQAAGTAYAIHGIPTIPFYIFYSMFGFQRVGDMIWSCADMMCRGFLLGGTAGRTTLNGEGIQHEDGHSQILASTVPNLKSYDPAFSFELAVIVREGIKRMYTNQENIFYYLTVYNEKYRMPALPTIEDIEQGILSGAYLYKPAKHDHLQSIQLLASGSIMNQALEAGEILEKLGYPVSIWSITSYNELSREALACERENRLNPINEPLIPFVEKLFQDRIGPIVAVTDYMKALPTSIAKWMPDNFTVLGTDGFGLSESRQDLRDYFEVSAKHIVHASLVALARLKNLDQKQLFKNMSSMDIDLEKPDPMMR